MEVCRVVCLWFRHAHRCIDIEDNGGTRQSLSHTRTLTCVGVGGWRVCTPHVCLHVQDVVRWIGFPITGEFVSPCVPFFIPFSFWGDGNCS